MGQLKVKSTAPYNELVISHYISVLADYYVIFLGKTWEEN
jgi:hypothetical protein